MRREAVVWLGCTLVSLIASAIASPDSGLTHSALCHIDTAWFMDAGRWMMQGLTPYIDYSDSKGPLLWLFYGLGYLLDPGGWQGMFWLYAIYYIFVYRMVWKIAFQLLGRSRDAAIVTLFMPLCYLLLGHQENRAEDLFQLPFLYILYQLVCTLGNVRPGNKQFYLMGVGTGVLLFIKWNMPVMMLPAMVAVLYIIYRDSGSLRTILRPLAMIGAGGLSVIIAVMGWMACVGAFQALINEYFIATVETGMSPQSCMSWIDTLSSIRHRFTDYLYFDAFLLCSGYVGYKLYGKRGLVFPLLLVLLCVSYSVHYINYYAQTDRSFGLFVPVAALLPLRKVWHIDKSQIAVAFILVSVILYWRVRSGHENFGHHPAEDGFFSMSHRVARLDNPRILYLNESDIALGIESEARPACKYWAGQWGMTHAMTEDQVSAMRTHSADVIVCGMETTEPQEYGYLHDETDVMTCSYPSAGLYKVYWSPAVYARTRP